MVEEIKKDLGREKNKDKNESKKFGDVRIGDYRVLIEFNEILEYYDKKKLEEQLNKNRKRLNLGLLENLVLESPFISLEEIVYSRDKKASKEKPYANVLYVPPSELPSGDGWRALGMYDPVTNMIYIANNLSPAEERFVYHHEVAHSLGIRNEAEADDYAASQTGYRIAA